MQKLILSLLNRSETFIEIRFFPGDIPLGIKECYLLPVAPAKVYFWL